MRKRIESAQQIEWLKKNTPSMTTRQLAEQFSEVFHVPTCQTQIRRMLERHGLQASGKKKSFVPVGTEMYNDYYKCMVVKTGDYRCGKGVDRKERDRQRNKNWTLKQNLVWEKANGRKLEWREVVIFLDGDRMNYDPENLFAVPMNVAGTIERMQMHSEDKDIYKTALIWGQLFFELKNARKRSEFVDLAVVQQEF